MEGLGFRTQDTLAPATLQGSGFRGQGSGVRVQGSGVRVQGLGLGDWTILISRAQGSRDYISEARSVTPVPPKERTRAVLRSYRGT